MLLRLLIVFPLVLSATSVLAEQQLLSCRGEGRSINLLTDQGSDPVEEEQQLSIRRDAGKAFLSIRRGAYIEASVEGDILSYADEPNMIGTRSMSFNPSSGALHYEAVATRHGEAVSVYMFTGTCRQGK